MDALTTAAFEERASSAEARLAILEAKLAAGVPAAAPQSKEDLQELKDLLVKAREETLKLQTERDEAVAMLKAKEVEVSKLQYRVKHLVKAVQEGDAKLAAK